MTLSVFSYICWPFVCPFVGVSIQVLCPFNQVVWLSCMSSLCILYINPLSDVSLANTFSYSVGYLFLFIVSFTVDLLNLMFSHLLIFYFVSLVWGDISKKILLRVMSEFNCLFSSSSLWFQVLYLSLQSIFSLFLHMMQVVQFHFFTCIWPVFPAPLIGKTILSPLTVLASFLTDQPCKQGSFWLPILFHWSVHPFLCRYYTALITYICSIVWYH